MILRHYIHPGNFRRSAGNWNCLSLLKQKTSYKTNYCLSLPEVLIALSICAMTNPIIEKAINQLDKLRNCEAHASYIIEKSELNVLKNLGINLTCEPKTYS